MLDALSVAIAFVQYHQIEVAVTCSAVSTWLITKALNFALTREGGW
jgi:hypothetical protein